MGIPFAGSQHPGGDEPEADGEDHEEGAWTDGHEGLDDELGVEVDAVEGADAAGGGVCEELAVQQHHPPRQVEAGEHEDGQDQLHVAQGELHARVSRPVHCKPQLSIEAIEGGKKSGYSLKFLGVG